MSDPFEFQALRALPQDPPLLSLITCYIPVPETNGEEWDRLPPEPAIGVLVAFALDGEYGMPGSVNVVGPQARRESLELRAAALKVFEVSRPRIDNNIPSDNETRLS